MAITGLQGIKISQACLDSGAYEPLAVVITDDFVFVSPSDGERTRDETLKFTEVAGVHIDDIDVPHDNDEVAVGFHTTKSMYLPLSRVTFFTRKEDSKFSYWRTICLAYREAIFSIPANSYRAFDMEHPSYHFDSFNK